MKGPGGRPRLPAGACAPPLEPPAPPERAVKNVKMELVAPKGDFVNLRLHNSKEFSKLSDPKAVLEKNYEQRLSSCYSRTNNSVTLFRVE